MGIYAVSRNDDVAVVYIKNPPNVWGTAYGTFAAIANAGVDVNMIIQTVSAGSEGKAVDIVFAIDRQDVETTRETLEKLFVNYEETEIHIDTEVAKVNVMGDEMQGKPGVAAKVFRCLWSDGVRIINISASEIGISMLIHVEDAEKAMYCLMQEFDI